VTVAQDTGGVRDAGQWIAAAKATHKALVDETHLVTRLYGLVNVPTAVWIDEQGRIVRPPEVAYADDRFKSFHGIESAPYVAAIRDWAEHGAKSRFVLSEPELRERLAPRDPTHAQADAEFALGEYLYKTGRGAQAVPHFKEAQRLNPDSWNFKRQAWALSDAQKDYGTTFRDEVRKLEGKPYYVPRVLERKKD
jgi:tetratricopeptide (TPR) repeat protein